MIILMQSKSRKSKNYCRYNKITQQKKFHLLTLVLKEKMLIKEAAKVVGVNYSTAKTIIFFHRNHGKSYQFDFRTYQKPQASPARIVASFLQIPLAPSTTLEYGQAGVIMLEAIDIVSTIGSKQTSLDFNSLQTRFMDKHLNQTNSPSPKASQLANSIVESEFGRLRNCQCERRITRAQSAMQAAQDTIYPPAEMQEKSYQLADSFQQLQNQ